MGCGVRGGRILEIAFSVWWEKMSWPYIVAGLWGSGTPREILLGLDNIQESPRGSCGFYRAGTQLVWDFIGTRMRFLEQEIHADFYYALHGVRVLFYKIRMCPSGDFTGALNTSRAPERFMRIL